MKNSYKLLFALFFVFIKTISFGQSSGQNKFNYQAVIRDATGAVLANQNVDIRFQIYDALTAGNLAYQEGK